MFLDNKGKLLIIIPARSGSTRIKNKNMKKLGDLPLLGHKIKSSLKVGLGKVIVSTDSKKITTFAKRLGAEVPFLRSKKYSTPRATMMSCILNVLDYFKRNNVKLPDYVALLPPTNPFLKTISIIKAYKKLLLKKSFNSICSLTESNDHPFLFVKLKKKLVFDIIKYEGHKLSEFERTQDWPKAFIYSSALRITKLSYYLKHIANNSPLINVETFDKKSCIEYKISRREVFDINTEKDFTIAKAINNNPYLLD